MARPSDNSLKYYNQDTTDDDNLQYVEAIHGLLGYAIVHKLWKKIYGGPGGYFCEWMELNQRLFCKDNGITLDDLNKILETCFAPGIEIFSKTMVDDKKVLTSKGIQKRWLKIVKECGRKHNTVSELYRLIDLQPVTTPETTPPVTLTGTETTQSKVKYSKGKESKENNTKVLKVTPQAPSPEEILKSDIRKKLIQVWWDFNKQKFGEPPPEFTATNGKKFDSIIEKLRKRAVKQQDQWSVQTAATRMLSFLNAAFADKWLSSHFLLNNLETQFDSIVMSQREKVRQAAPVVSIDQQIENLKKDFIEPDVKFRLSSITREHYEYLHKTHDILLSDDHRNLAKKRRAEELIMSNNAAESELAKHYLNNEDTFLTKKDLPNLELFAMRYAVMDWLYVASKPKEEAVA